MLNSFCELEHTKNIQKHKKHAKNKLANKQTNKKSIENMTESHFSSLIYTSNFEIGTLVATLPGIWHYRGSAGTGFNLLWLD